MGSTDVQVATFSCLVVDAQLSLINRGPNDWVYADNFIHIAKSKGKKPEDVLEDWKKTKEPKMSQFSPQLRTFNELSYCSNLISVNLAESALCIHCSRLFQFLVN